MSATRATATEVREIITTTITDITPFLRAANALVTAKLTSKDIGDDLLREIEKWIAAHFIFTRDSNVSNEKIGDASITYRNPGVLQTGLESTFYGQQALILDCSGTLATLGKKGAFVQSAFTVPDA